MTLLDVAFVLGLAAITAGFTLVAPAAGLIVGGTLVAAPVWLITKGQRRQRAIAQARKERDA